VACQVQLWLAQGNLAAASRWAQESELSAEAEFSPRNEFEHITLARVLIAQGRAEPDGTTLHTPLGLLERLSQAAESAGRIGHLIELLILKALALEAQGDLNRALASLERALELAEPQGYVRTFVDKGEPMARLLREAAERGMAPTYVSNLLTAIETQDQPDLPAPLGQAGGAPPTPPTSPLIEPLTDRELEVLRLMAEGLTYNEIAGQILVSLNTVRTHVKNIYSKLLVHKRSQAIAKARELNLL
jgi:LuxR family maltose regulon positive regulatory protein